MSLTSTRWWYCSGEVIICGFLDALVPAAALREESSSQSTNYWIPVPVRQRFGVGGQYTINVYTFSYSTSSLLVPDCHRIAPHLLLSIPVDFPDSPVFFQCRPHTVAGVIFLKTNWNSHCIEDKLSPVLDGPVSVPSPFSSHTFMPWAHHLSARLVPFWPYWPYWLSLSHIPDEVFS